MWQELQRSLEPLTSKEKQRYGEYHKITPVSHTNIGGYLKPWMDMWIDFWDSEADKIEWVGLDEFMEDNDWELPLWQIPLNKNNPYTPEKIRPAVSYDDIEKIHNPCLVEDIGNPDREETIYEEKEAFSVGNKMMMFHNGQGDMCLEMLEFLEEIDYPIEEYLDTDPGFREKLDSLLNEFSSSEGIHPLFNYYPITFIKTRAFSGFNESIGNEILKEIEK